MQVQLLAPVPYSKLAPFHNSRQDSAEPTLPASGGAHPLPNQILKKVTGVSSSFGCSAVSIQLEDAIRLKTDAELSELF